MRIRHAESAETRLPHGGSRASTRGELPVGIDHVLDAQALATPEALAIAFDGENLSYRELHARADHLARQLCAAGLGREVLAGLCVERSPEMIVALLAILKTGGAYLPLDPGYPEPRLRFMLRDALPPLLVTTCPLLKRLEGFEGRVVLLDDPGDELPAGAPQQTARKSSDLAYVIYTSGSTGQPKGVMVEHGGLLSLARAQAAIFNPSPTDRILQFASLSFDASIFEIVMALASGASLHLAARDASLPGAPLARLLRERRITQITLPPSTLATLSPEDLPDLRTVIVAGEACPQALAERWSRGRRFFNAYGPTETTVWATTAEFQTGSAISIGTPIPDAQVHVLDDSLRPVPDGEAGELHIGGAGVARGYLRREMLTAERFIPDPFRAASGARLYRSGDLGRRRADGSIEFLGRIDAQVKIRGFRIEPGEIEAALAAHPGVRECAVVARQFAPGDHRLIGYVAPRDAAGPTSHELHEFLQRSLPAHLIPATIVPVESIARLPNGKLNRAALPAPAIQSASGSGSPRNALEQTIAATWCDVLQIEHAEIGDSFFDYGGDSLLAAHLLARLSAGLGVELSLREFFDAPTITALAQCVESARAAGRTSAAAVITRVPRDQTLPLSPAQERLWFLQRLDPGSSAYHLGIELAIDGPLDTAKLESSLTALVTRHEILRTIYPDEQGAPRQVILPADTFRVVTVDLADAPDRDGAAHEFALAEMRRPFDLARGPLFHATLLRLGTTTHRLIIVMHHIVSDGWSHGIFLRELSALYSGQTLAVLPFQYADFAASQRAQDSQERSLDYWQHQLAGPLPDLELPTLADAGATPTRLGATLGFTIPADVTEAVRQLGRREGTTLFMTLLAAFHALLARYSGQDDIVIGTPVANRASAGLDALIGFFVNTLALRSDVSADPDFREMLRRTRRTALDAFEHQALPFERLVSALAPERQLHRQPLFRVMFALQNAPVESPKLPGLTVTVRELAADTAIFDLTLQIEETPKGLAGTIQYDTGLFAEPGIAALAGDFAAVLAAIAANPALTLHALPVSRARIVAAEDHRLAEIEAALLDDPAVADAAVLARTTLESERRVVAYVVISQPAALTPIRTRFAARLPATLAPDDWVSLSAIPRTATGRVNREALASIPVLDPALARRTGEKLRGSAGISDAVVLVTAPPTPQPRLHLSALLPGWRRCAPAQREPGESRAQSSQVAADAEAISHGAPLRIAPDAPSTLAEALDHATERGTGGLIFLEAGVSAELRPYASLLDESRRILSGLRNAGVRPRDRVVFQFDRNADFIAAFWGCVLGGFIPVPVSLSAGPEAAATKLQHVCAALPDAVVLTSERITGSLPTLGATSILEIESQRRHPAQAHPHSAQPDDVALLMLTSGSTSVPKLVQLTHRNLLSRSAASIQMHGFTSEDVSFNWMPLDHVAGLVYFHLRDVTLGCRQIHAATSEILESPLRWIDRLAEHRATITFAPNFAFGLINACAGEIALRKWDLSTLRFVLNGAESIVAETARRFVALLAPHALAASAMRPAWGMAETSSGVTYADRLAETLPGFVEVGTPVPGLSIRIVDSENQLLHESEIGRLQVRGPMVTPGYLDAQDANREGFTTDGWFDTGDLGVLRHGRLTITGRAREVIIINGVNYHSHEIESVVERVPGVRSSLAAAFAIRESGADTDQLAIVFCPAEPGDADALRIAAEIRERVASEGGVTPAFVMPVAPDEIPKTAIGKIQRTQLRQRFERGEFDAMLARLDVLSANANTLPAWFYRRVWRRRAPGARLPRRGRGATVVFSHGDGIGAALCAQLGPVCIVVEPATEFAQLDAHRFAIRAAHPEDYRQLIETILRDGHTIERIVHLWSCAPVDVANVDSAQDAGLFSIVALAQALARAGCEQPIRLLAASIGAQATTGDEAIEPAKTPLLGLLRTIPRELPWLRCRHVDLPADSANTNATRMLTELETASHEPEVAWREHRRLIPLLERISFAQDTSQPLPFVRGGVYLVTGGFGGIGAHVARYLREEFDAKLLIVGRSPLAERAQALAALGDDATYEQADICELEPMRAAITRAEARWNRKLDGILHLAGIAHDCALLDETREGISSVLAPKVRGTCILEQLLAARPDALFITFSSVNALFGGSGFAAYAAANRFLESVAHERRRSGARRTWCLAWSAWDGVGMNRQARGRQLAEAQGFETLSAAQGLLSLAAILQRREPLAWIGLDGGNPQLLPAVAQLPRNQHRLTAWIVTHGEAEAAGETSSIRDSYGVAAPCEVIRIPHLPRTPCGEIDLKRLPSANPERERVAPRTEAEKRLTKLWQQVLETAPQSVHENFFHAGGHSLLAAQLMARVSEEFQLDLRLPALFEAPTIAGLAALVERRLAAPAATAPPPLEPGSRGPDAHLSFAQERLWFLDQLERELAVYNVPIALRLRGELDAEALARALDEIVRRHETLRTVFTSKDGQPSQVIAATGAVAIEIVDVRAEPDPEASAMRAARNEAKKRFDLSARPPFRVRLLRLGTAEHVLLLTFHHIIADGWSYGVLARELSELYAAHVAGRMAALLDLAIQYRDYAHWQREWLQGESLARQLAYWRKQLAGAPAAIELPADRVRPSVEAFRGAWMPVRIARELTRALETLSQREGVTLFMTLLAAFQTLLHRHSGATDIVVGTPVAGRSRRETEPLIGFFANTLALRSDLSGDPTFRDLLLRVREIATGAYAHEDLPFEKVVEVMNPVRDLSRHPIFQVMFALQNEPLIPPSLPGLDVTWMHVDPGTSMFDLNLFLERTGEGLKGLLEYNTDLFDPATMARFAGHLTTLLEGIVRNPDERLSRLPLLTEAERRQLLIEWNDTRFEYPPVAALHELLESQCRRTPDATAVIFDEARWTYAELNREANRWAHRLRALGVGRDVIVGICAERSLELVAGLLGILKAGGAYLPLDPEYPRERLALMIEDANPPVILTQQRLAGGLPPTPARVLFLDAPPDDGTSDLDPAHANAPEDLAYVIYTSGSTGQPKGVMNTHRGICNRLLWMQRAHGLMPDDAVLQKTPFSFDVSVWEFFWPLFTGARLVLARPGGHRDAAYLIALIQRERITTMHFVPSMLSAFLDVPGVAQCGSLRRVICSGEELTGELQARFFASSQAELHNLYGPTEAAVDVTFWKCERGEIRRSVPIGRPIDNTQIHLLDAHLQPVPVGVAGELHIGGVSLARGYLRRPDLTSERFIADPFSRGPDARLYKTGDLARYLPCGAIEFLGRTDHQVKIRGFRVEPGEIETVLRSDPSVRQAMVIAREDQPGDLRLVAYIVGHAGNPPDAAKLRDTLQRQLPDYMVPTQFVTLNELPRTSSGKMDRAALPSPQREPRAAERDPITPQMETESQLASLWKTVLGVQPTSLHDDFFDLGGHSLAAVRLCAAIARQFGVTLPVAALFRAPTIGQLAAAIRCERDPAPCHAGLIAIQPHGTRRPIFWIPSAGDWIPSPADGGDAWQGIGAGYYVSLARQLGQDQPSYSFAPVRDIGGPLEFAAHCVKLLRKMQPHGPYVIAAYCIAGEIAYEVARQLQRMGEEVESLIVFEGYAPTSRYALSEMPTDTTSRRTRRIYSELLAKGLPAILRRISRRLGTIRHQRTLRGYQDQPYAGRALLFRTEEALAIAPDDLGWNALIRPAPERIVIPATHLSMLSEPSVRLIAAEMMRRLDTGTTK